MFIDINCPYCGEELQVSPELYIDSDDVICSDINECPYCESEIAFSVSITIAPVKVSDTPRRCYTLEDKRKAIVTFLQESDPNGCYSDEQSTIEHGNIVDYATALKYFMWYANQFDKSLNDADEASSIICNDGRYEDTMFCMLYMAKLHHGNNSMLRYFYRLLWTDGCSKVASILRNDLFICQFPLEEQYRIRLKVIKYLSKEGCINDDDLEKAMSGKIADIAHILREV